MTTFLNDFEETGQEVQLPTEFFVEPSDQRSTQLIGELQIISDGLRDIGFEYLVNCARFPQILNQIRKFEETLFSGFITKLARNSAHPEAFSTESILTIP